MAVPTGGLAAALAQLAEIGKWGGMASQAQQQALMRRMQAATASQLANNRAPSPAGTTGGRGPGRAGISQQDWNLAQKWGSTYGVDPMLLVAIGMHETHWGKLGDGRNGNILGVGSYDSGSSYKWAGLNNQLRKGAEILANHGVHNISDVSRGKASWWATDPNWAPQVVNWYNRIS